MGMMTTSSSRLSSSLWTMMILLMELQTVVVESLQFRTVPTDDDINMARKILLQEKMNPLSISKERLLVAYDDTKSNVPLCGFGQIRPLDNNNNNKDDDTVDNEYSELASLYVLPEYRKQGIGGQIVQTLLDRHYDLYDENENEGNKDDDSKQKNQMKMTSTSTTTPQKKKKRVCLLTLRPTSSFYEPYGFHIASEKERKSLPSTIQMEYMAGNALSFILGNDLICMVN